MDTLLIFIDSEYYSSFYLSTAKPHLAHHLVDLGHVTSGHPLTLEAQLSLGIYCSDSFDSTSSFSCSNYDVAMNQFKIHGPKRMKQANP